jgi:hypothetical protein
VWEAAYMVDVQGFEDADDWYWGGHVWRLGSNGVEVWR